MIFVSGYGTINKAQQYYGVGYIQSFLLAETVGSPITELQTLNSLGYLTQELESLGYISQEIESLGYLTEEIESLMGDIT
jgi:hypothetical protein